jgi:hypothetical protein
MQVGTTAMSSYGNEQTINSGIQITTTGVNTTSSSKLNLFFSESNSTFQINGDSTITNFTLAGDAQAQFNINGGTTTIAQSPGYTETIGVQVTVEEGATLNDQSWNPLQFTNSGLAILVLGTMRTYYGPGTGMTLIDSGAFSRDYIFVDGTLSYAGSGGVADTFNAPVYVSQGTFLLSTAANQPAGAKLTVNGTVPGQTPNASVYLAGNGTVQLSQGFTLVCNNGYYQNGGTLETTDSTQCTLQGTATIDAGGNLQVDDVANSYGRLNLIGNLNLNGKLSVSVEGYTPNGSEGPSDLLYVSGTLTLNKTTSTIFVNDYGTLQKGTQYRLLECHRIC